MGHLERFNILVDPQHCFSAKRSTETQLILAVNDIAKTLKQGSSIHMAILDFSKAFDKVPHEHLLTKLHHYGIQGNPHYGIQGDLHTWLKNFLLTELREVPVRGICHHHRKCYLECRKGQH